MKHNDRRRIKVRLPTRAEGLTGRERIKVPHSLLKGLLRPSRSPQEVARRALVRGIVLGMRYAHQKSFVGSDTAKTGDEIHAVLPTEKGDGNE